VGLPIRVRFSFLVLGVVVSVLLDPILHRNLPTVPVNQIHFIAGAIGALLLLSVALHEVGHAVASRRLASK